MAYLRSGIDGGRASNSLVRNRVVDIRGDLATGGKLLLTTTEPTVVDGNELGRIDFQAPLDTAGTDAILVAASIVGEATGTFSSSVNTTSLVFMTGESETAAERMRLTATGRLGINTDSPAGELDVRGTVFVGVDDTGHDVKFFGASAGAFMLYDQSEDTLEIRGASADATTSTGKLLLTTALTDINDGDVIGRIDFKAPLEAGGTDAILAGASIWAEADATFSSSVNSTDLVFATGDSDTATEKLRIDSTGQVTFADGAIDVNIASHDGSNGLKLGGTLVTATAANLNATRTTATTGKAIAMAIVFA